MPGSLGAGRGPSLQRGLAPPAAKPGSPTGSCATCPWCARGLPGPTSRWRRSRHFQPGHAAAHPVAALAYAGAAHCGDGGVLHHVPGARSPGPPGAEGLGKSLRSVAPAQYGGFRRASKSGPPPAGATPRRLLSLVLRPGPAVCASSFPDEAETGPVHSSGCAHLCLSRPKPGTWVCAHSSAVFMVTWCGHHTKAGPVTLHHGASSSLGKRLIQTVFAPWMSRGASHGFDWHSSVSF